MKVCIVYDCLYPCTVGGAERWYRGLAQALSARGHRVTYLTLTQWESGDPPRIPGVSIVPVGPRMALYHRGRRRVIPPLRFGWGVLRHLLRHGRDYDVVHTASFPFFSLLAIGLTRYLHRFRVICDWHEVWSRAYWRGYLGRSGGELGWLIQRLCAGVPQQAYTFSRLHASRLASLGVRGTIGILSGEYAGNPPLATSARAAAPPVVLCAGRLVPEKRVPLLVEAVCAARRSIPQLGALIFGTGPELDRIRHRIAELGLDEAVRMAGFASEQELAAAMARALCVVQPSSREGYGMVVVEAFAAGVPAIVVAGEDNAAVELIEPGCNGFIASGPDPECLSAAIVQCWSAGDSLRIATREWYARNAQRLSLRHSLEEVLHAYAPA